MLGEQLHLDEWAAILESGGVDTAGRQGGASTWLKGVACVTKQHCTKKALSSDFSQMSYVSGGRLFADSEADVKHRRLEVAEEFNRFGTNRR